MRASEDLLQPLESRISGLKSEEEKEYKNTTDDDESNLTQDFRLAQ